MDLLKPIVVAISVYMVPVWYLTESAAWLLEARGVRQTTWAQFVLRVLPPVVALALVSLSPRVLAEIIGSIRGEALPEAPGLSELALFALVTGAAAVQLHQWRIPQSLGAALRTTIRRIGGGKDKDTP